MGDDAELKLLPPRTRQLAKRIGLPALRKLSRKWGGVTIYVPSEAKLQREHPLARAIGWDAAQALADKEGVKLEVPMANEALHAATREQIRLYRREHSERETAQHFHVTQRWVRHIVAMDEPENRNQPDLFSAD